MMATYLEIAQIYQDAGYADLVHKIETAIQIKAHAIAQEASPTTEKLTWAKEALAAPEGKRKQIEGYLFAANKGAAVSVMVSSADNTIQSNVDDAVDKLLGK